MKWNPSISSTTEPASNLPVPTGRNSIQYQIIPGDRIALCKAAEAIVEIFSNKSSSVDAFGDSKVASDLSGTELKAYHSALDYLRRQFDTGFVDPVSLPISKTIQG